MGAQADLIASLADLDLGIQPSALQKVAPMSELILKERLELLSHLKDAGFPLTQRQKVANLLASAKREGRIVMEARAASTDVSDPAAPGGSSKCSPPAGITSIKLTPGHHCRVWVISDAHSDHPANLAWIKTRLPARVPKVFDVCVCAGDVSDNADTLRETLGNLMDRFDAVVFTAGNHDVVSRCHRMPSNAIECH